jgi:predicted nucleic acid-binding protein
MRFWDASALVTLVIDDPLSERANRWSREDPEIAAWCLTPTEVWSAVARRRHEGKLGSPDVRRARETLARLATMWNEIDDIPGVRQRAARLLDVHRLRVADALQLAAALVAVQDRPETAAIVTLDVKLAAAADIEGFKVIGAEPE